MAGPFCSRGEEGPPGPARQPALALMPSRQVPHERRRSAASPCVSAGSGSAVARSLSARIHSSIGCGGPTEQGRDGGTEGRMDFVSPGP